MSSFVNSLSSGIEESPILYLLYGEGKILVEISEYCFGLIKLNFAKDFLFSLFIMLAFENLRMNYSPWL